MSEKADSVKTKAKNKIAGIRENRKKRVEEVKTKIKNAVSKHVNKQGNANTVKQNKLELLVTIVGRNKAEYYLDLIQSAEVNMQFLALAHGTADEQMRSYIGLTDSDKVVIFSVIQEAKVADILNALQDKFNTIKNGKGIAFTIPFSSVIGTLIYGFLSNNKMAVKENK